MDMGFVHGMEAAMEIVEQNWRAHSNFADVLIDVPNQSEQFYKHIAICGALNTVLMQLNDNIEESIKKCKEAV